MDVDLRPFIHERLFVLLLSDWFAYCSLIASITPRQWGMTKCYQNRLSDEKKLIVRISNEILDE